MKDGDHTFAIIGVFALLSLLSFGGGNAILPEMHRQTVEMRHWLSDTQFTDLFALSRASPGPNILIVTLIGWHVGGLLGAFVATVALCLPSGMLTYGFARIWHKFRGTRWRRAVQLGLAPVTVGLTFAGAYVVTRAADHSVVAYALTAATTVIALIYTKISPLWLFLVAGIAGAAGLV